MSDVDYASMSDEELEAAAAALADERTRVRLEQNVCQAEVELRIMLKNMSGAARHALVLRLTGDATPAGASKAEKTK